jgi:peptidoglycan/LPS O-acetylase OafA/YrhL
MSQFSDPIPVNAEKVHALHAQEELPGRPALSRMDMAKVWAPMAIGILFALGAVALGFQARASWESHRDWVVPVTVPLLVIGGMAMGYLTARMRLKALAVPIGLLSIAMLFVLLNIIRGNSTTGDDGLRDALSIMTGVLLGASVLTLTVAFAWSEFQDPVKPPAPEM